MKLLLRDFGYGLVWGFGFSILALLWTFTVFGFIAPIWIYKNANFPGYLVYLLCSAIGFVAVSAWYRSRR